MTREGREKKTARDEKGREKKVVRRRLTAVCAQCASEIGQTDEERH